MRPARWLWLLVLAGTLPAGAADPAEKEFAAAKKLTVRKCVKCHKFYKPDDYTVADWNMWMAKMARKSKLNSRQTDQVTRYLETLRSRPEPPPPR